jgi:hypothetical protein
MDRVSGRFSLQCGAWWSVSLFTVVVYALAVLYGAFDFLAEIRAGSFASPMTWVLTLVLIGWLAFLCVAPVNARKKALFDIVGGTRSRYELADSYVYAAWAVMAFVASFVLSLPVLFLNGGIF